MRKLYLRAWNMKIRAIKIEAVESIKQCDNAIL